MTSQERAFCYRCAKPHKLCLCDRVCRVNNKTGVVILQHCRERHHPLGTARIVRLGFQGVSHHVLFKDNDDGSSHPVALPPGAALLYPADDARDLAEMSPEERPEHLVVLDGTWWQAHQMYRDNPWIQALPHVRIQPHEASRYRIRKEPRFECVSSLEAVIGAMRHVEPELEGLDGVLASFESMIDQQIEAAHTSARRPRRKRVRNGRPRAIPWPIVDSPESVVLVYAEAAHGPVGRSRQRDLLQVTAVRLDSDEVFEALVRTEPEPEESFLGLLDLSPADLEVAESLEEVQARFSRFCGETVVLAAWNAGSIRLLGRLGIDTSRGINLKGVWANLTRQGVPALWTLVERAELTVEPLALRGRARFRLAQVKAVVHHMLALAREEQAELESEG